jgi:hypothetical protein
MPDVTISTLNLEALSALELDQRRSAIVDEMRTKYRGYDDPAVPETLLHELAAITARLRLRNSGPPKTKTVAKRAAKTPATTDDLLI